MYLLKPIAGAGGLINSLFTFHYVSIKTNPILCAIPSQSIFTFHYVSIKTHCHIYHFLYNKPIYIPLCIY